jgi:hypothetical protein
VANTNASFGNSADRSNQNSSSGDGGGGSSGVDGSSRGRGNFPSASVAGLVCGLVAIPFIAMMLVIGVKLRRRAEPGSCRAAAGSSCDVEKDVKTVLAFVDKQPYVIPVASSILGNDCAMHYTEVALPSTATAGQEPTNSTHYTASPVYAIPFGSPEHAMQHRSGAASNKPSLCTDGYVIDDAVDGNFSTNPVYAQPYEYDEVDCGESNGRAHSTRGTPGACAASISGTHYEYADVVA